MEKNQEKSELKPYITEILSITTCLYCGFQFKSGELKCPKCLAKSLKNWPQHQVFSHNQLTTKNKTTEDNLPIPLSGKLDLYSKEEIAKLNEKFESNLGGIPSEKILFTILVGCLFIYFGMGFGASYGFNHSIQTLKINVGCGNCYLRSISFYEHFIIRIHEDDLFTYHCAIFGAFIGSILAILISLSTPPKVAKTILLIIFKSLLTIFFLIITFLGVLELLHIRL